ncbi:unnamed protein product [Mytilus edulis]|uniref:Uncharacterized protein n=1 Tax=Mytilus edulis TaxID=6550 RepID=A0A8S3R462_MYTED|nr:unnamed protein product [Mytilus edulis]
MDNLKNAIASNNRQLIRQISTNVASSLRLTLQPCDISTVEETSSFSFDELSQILIPDDVVVDTSLIAIKTTGNGCAWSGGVCAPCVCAGCVCQIISPRNLKRKNRKAKGREAEKEVFFSTNDKRQSKKEGCPEGFTQVEKRERCPNPYSKQNFVAFESSDDDFDN